MRRGLVLVALLAGCSSAQLKDTNAVYEDLHAIRKGVESIPFIVPLVDAEFPWAVGVRLGLDGAYKVKHTLLPDNFAAQLASSVSPTATALTSTTSVR